MIGHRPVVGRPEPHRRMQGLPVPPLAEGNRLGGLVAQAFRVDGQRGVTVINRDEARGPTGIASSSC